MPDFDRTILASLESAFAAGETDVLIFTPDSGELSYAVKLIHKPTGIEILSDEFASQIKNKAVALAELLGRLV